MTTALAKTNGTPGFPLARSEMTSPLAAVAARNLDDVFRLAEVAAKSGLYGVKSPEDAFIRMATGMELGLSAIQSLRGIWVLNGKPSLGAELMVALCLKHPECERFEMVTSTKEESTWRTVRRGHETKLSWTMEQARQAKLAGGNVWQAYGETMLRWRCASALAKLVYADILAGLLSTEEASSIDERRAPVEVHDGVVSPTVEPARVVPPVVVADAEYTQVEDPSIAESERLEQMINAAPTLAARDEAVKELVKAFKAKKIGQLQYDGLGECARLAKVRLAGGQ